MTLGMTNETNAVIYELIADESYDVREDGMVWRWYKTAGEWRRTGKSMTKGYYHMKYKGKSVRLHRVIYAKFNGELDVNLIVDHKDGNPTNNLPSNLQQTTSAKNTQKGKVSKLTAEDVREIKKLKAEGWKQNAIAKKFGVSQANISLIINNNQWKGVE